MLGLLLLAGCRAPALPPEAVQAELKADALRAAGAERYAPSAYAAFCADLARVTAALEHERQRLFGLRDFRPMRSALTALLARGDVLLAEIEETRRQRAGTLAARIDRVAAELDQVKHLTTLLNEGRISRRSLTHAAALTEEARRHSARGNGPDAEAALTRAEALSRHAWETLRPLLARFADAANLARWRAWREETLRESARTGQYAILVSKIERRLTLYRAGVPVRSFEVALGVNGFSEKRVAGDRATPEGRYHVVRKNAASRFYRALLIDYPNAADLERFRESKRLGLIQRDAGVGGLIEIHGGGAAGMTYGCVALENPAMQTLFSLVPVGTPVTIVGALDSENVVARSLREYAGRR